MEPELPVPAHGFYHETGVPRELLEVTENHRKVRKTEKPPKIVKRGKPKNKVTSLIILSTNAASLKSKLKSFKHELKRSLAGVFTLQETHYATKGKVVIDDFEIFEAIRKGKQKGGTMIGAHRALKPILINELNVLTRISKTK